MRLFLPIRLRCDACGFRHDMATPFAAHKEDLTAGERYIGAPKVFRFYFKCLRCRAQIIYKTGPEENHYTVKAGATRELN